MALPSPRNEEPGPARLRTRPITDDERRERIAELMALLNPPHPEDEDRLITVREAARMLGRSVTALANRWQTICPEAVVRVDRRVFFSRRKLAALIARGRRA